MSRSSKGIPELSVLIPTYGRGEAIRRLLAHLERQTLAPDRFEAVVVDDGSPEPVQLAGSHTMPVMLLRQANAGPGAARNLGAQHCRAPWTLLLNDDAVPAPDLLERHLARARTLSPRTALLGTFDFTPAALHSPFTQVLQHSDLLFDFPGLRDGGRHPWTFFWTCNLGLPTATLRAHPFDAERFREAIVEDVELGYRLATAGWQVQFDRSLVAHHDHPQQPAGYFRRMVRLGVNMVRMADKHHAPELLYHFGLAMEQGAWHGALQRHVEVFHDTFRKTLASLEAMERERAGSQLAAHEIETIRTVVRQIGSIAFFRGVLLERDGQDPFQVIEAGPRQGDLTSVIVLSHNQLAMTQRCLAALRAAADPRHPTEWIFVDNGSTDGSAEWLAAQPDVVLLRNDRNLGAPVARNQGLAVAGGQWLVVMDNDAIVTPGWLRRLLHHAQVDARAGCVGPVANRAAHDQQVAFPGADDAASLQRFADALHAANPRAAEPHNMLTSFCLLFSRRVLEAIGGFDPRFSPWGFEDDDFTLRAALAGFRNRIARDVFVYHAPCAGPKVERHAALLVANWRSFAAKWAGDTTLPQGDYAAVERLMGGRKASLNLFVPLDKVPPPAQPPRKDLPVPLVP